MVQKILFGLVLVISSAMASNFNQKATLYSSGGGNLVLTEANLPRLSAEGFNDETDKVCVQGA